MQRFAAVFVASLLTLLVVAPLTILAHGGAAAVPQQCDLRARVDGVTGPWQAVDPARYPELCVAPVPTATATARPTSTPRPPTPTRTPTAPRTATSTLISPTRTPNPPTNTPNPSTATNTPGPSPISQNWYIPAPSVTWAWQLTGTIDLSARAGLYDVDLFDTSAATVAAIHAQGGKAVCYLSAGTWEDWRPDAGQFPASVKGSGNGWPGEKWLDIRNLSLRPIMAARLDTCKAKGFDAVEPDNIDGYANSTGFTLTAADQLAYNRWLAAEAHARGLGIALKNDAEQVRDLVGAFDFAIVEECVRYNECAAYSPFHQAGRAVLAVEYQSSTATFCPQLNALGFRGMKKRESLDAWVSTCWGQP